MQRFSWALAIVLASALAAPLEATPVSPKAVKGKAGVAKPGGRAKVPTPGGPKDPSALWWNDPAIAKALSLTDEQRNKMEAHLTTYRKDVPRGRRADAFHETLVQGVWAKARSENKKLSDIAGTSVRLRGNLKVDVLSVLSAEQHQQLVDKYPRLIYKPWMSAMRGAPE